jgi:putative acetyltransferase
VNIRRGREADHAALLGIWLRSVRATHHFLSEADVTELTAVVRDQALPHLELWVLEADGKPVGFLGLHGHRVEALFIDPAHARKGGGRRLLEHARTLKGQLLVDVNEQNPEATRFYLANGFVKVGRSERDGAGRPFPLLHLRDVGS